jgi:hypothetical protein
LVDHLAFSQFFVEALALEELLRHIPAVILCAHDGDTSVNQKIIPSDTLLYFIWGFESIHQLFNRMYGGCRIFLPNKDDMAFLPYGGHLLFNWMGRSHDKLKCPNFLIRVKKNTENLGSSITIFIPSGEFDLKRPLDGVKSALTKFQNGYLCVFPDRSNNAASHPCAGKQIENLLENFNIQPDTKLYGAASTY